VVTGSSISFDIEVRDMGNGYMVCEGLVDLKKNNVN
jgi:hypothetical protein